MEGQDKLGQKPGTIFSASKRLRDAPSHLRDAHRSARDGLNHIEKFEK
jgi:hypothetical protein